MIRASPWLVLMLLLALPGWGQSGNAGAVEGTVTDSTGAVIPGVRLEARNLDTAAVAKISTNELGLFRFLVLPVGTYEVVARHPGFAALILKDVVVTVGARINLPLALRVATRSESVVVSEQTPLVETTRSQVSSTMDQQSIANLPLKGRNLFGFVGLIPGAGAGGGIAFAGRSGLHSFQVDGADDIDTWFNTPIGGYAGSDWYQFSQEAVREFQVNINAYSAELGRAGTGLVNMVTKSGSNHFHGTAFWYLRDKGLNATDLTNKIVGQPKDPLHVQQFGGALGGPIRKDRLFFFGNYDGQRRQQKNLTFLNLPSSFTLSSSPKVAAFQQRALDYLAPRAASWLRSFDQNVYLAKLDWRITPTQLLSGRWNRQRFSGTGQLNSGPQVSVETSGTLGQNNDILAVSLTSTLSPAMVNTVRFSYVRHNQPATAMSVNPTANVFEGGQAVLNVGRNSTAPREIAIRRSEFADTLLFSHGRHNVKTGVNLLRDGVTFTTTINFSGVYRFNSLESFGRSLAGTPLPVAGDRYVQAFSGEEKPGIRVSPESTEFAAFFEDEWRIRPSLTLNLGLRYDVQVMARATVKNPSPALAAAGLDTSFVPLDTNNFAPRIGFAWNLLRERLAVRGGYGIFYPRVNALQVSRALYQNGVSVQTRTFTAGTPSAAFIPAYPNTLCGPPTPSGIAPSCPPPIGGADTLMPFAPDFRQPMVQQGSFGIEYQLEKNWAISVSYLAARGIHQTRYRDVNLAAPALASIGIAGTSTVLSYRQFSSSRPIAGFDRILVLASDANSIYHGMTVQVRKRFSRNYQLLVGYTLGKAIDDSPQASGAGDGNMPSDPLLPRLDRGPGDADQRHRLVLIGIWQLHYADHLPQPARAVLQGWELSGILTAQSGLAYSAMVNFDLNNDGNAATDRPPGVGRNTFYTPATVSLDPRLTRTVPLREQVRLQFIWEAFNVFNRANITGVRTTQFSRSTSAAVCGIAGAPCLVPQNTGSTAFGTPTGTLGPRIMQFAVKLTF
jgi:hypothetical protein